MRKIHKTDENSSVVVTLVNIAEQWKNMGDFKKALEQLERVLRKKSSLDNKEINHVLF